MPAAVLVINAGSSSIKFAAYADAGDNKGDGPDLVCKGQLEGIGSDPGFIVKDAAGGTLCAHDEWPRGSPLDHAGAMRFILGWLDESGLDLDIVAAGHRVVHGGLDYDRPIRIDEAVLTALAALIPLAPLHQPHNLAGIRAIAEVNPSLPQVACFDTAFHRNKPPAAEIFALPRALTDSGIHRYGFHGLSYEYIARRLPQVVPQARRVVVAHLGNGASMCAIRDGRSVDSTMGFTAVDGLPMGTRTGALDPGVVLYLLQARGYTAEAIERLLYKESGLLGVSEISNDMRDLLASDDPRAGEAIDLFCYQIAKNLGALAAAAGGLDAFVFTAGIGEHAAEIRARVCAQAAWMGIRLDPAANERDAQRLSADDSAVSVWVIPTDEERMIAIHTRSVLTHVAAP
ncbi:MAG: acetate/propionate family kinase [Rhodospirillales bacterium]|nr:acetate/propionate family kinase [Rhodospirillales bacterium]